MKRDRFDIKINGKSTQNQIASYLVRVVLGLRDKENEEGVVRLLGSGTAIPHVILVSEIIRSRIKGVSSIVEFESLEKEGRKPDEQHLKFNVPAIRIKLTTNPNQEDQTQSGYQQPYQVTDDKHVELFDYVMMYAENLYYWGGGRHRDRRNKNNNDNYNNERQRRDNRDNNRDNRDIDQVNKSENWNTDRAQFQEQNNNQEQKKNDLRTRGEYRNYRGNNRDNNRENDRKEQSQEKRDQNEKYVSKRPTDQQRNENRNIRPKPQKEFENRDDKVVQRGQIRTRGGQRRTD